MMNKDWNFYHCGLCDVDFAVSVSTDLGDTSCPKCESGEDVYLINSDVTSNREYL